MRWTLCTTANTYTNSVAYNCRPQDGHGRSCWVVHFWQPTAVLHEGVGVGGAWGRPSSASMYAPGQQTEEK